MASLSLAVLFAAGCGSNGNGLGVPFSGNTTVVLLASSTANDDLTSLNVNIDSLTLTTLNGKQLTVLASPVGDGFIHLNGPVEPMVTVSVPQGVYSSASATYGGPATAYCAWQVPGSGTAPGTNYYGNMDGSTDSTISLSKPIVVTGTAMGLVLNLHVSPLPGGCPAAFDRTFKSAFSLTPMDFASPPTSSTNGLALGLLGVIGSVNSDGTGMTVNPLASVGYTPAPWPVSLSKNTLFQGVSGASELAKGLPVDMDLAIQPDGSFVATRVQVLSTETANLTLASGPLDVVVHSIPVTHLVGDQAEGPLAYVSGGIGTVSFGNAQFQISGQFRNLASLPFNASFNARNMVAGQNVTVTTQATSFQGGPTYVPVTTMTLMPQTIDATVSAISAAGNFTAYTVTLAPYDLFPQFAVQGGQTTLLTDPSTVVVYTDSSTQMLNGGPIAVGSVARFYGLIFNDNGTLRMDCAQVNDGVAE